MSERIKILEHKGQKVLFLDGTKLKPQELVDLFPEGNKIAIASQIHLYILDISNTHAGDVIRQSSRDAIAELQQKVGDLRIAMIGVNPLQRIIASAVKRDIYFAANQQDALNWLVSQPTPDSKATV